MAEDQLLIDFRLKMTTMKISCLMFALLFVLLNENCTGFGMLLKRQTFGRRVQKVLNMMITPSRSQKCGPSCNGHNNHNHNHGNNNHNHNHGNNNNINVAMGVLRNTVIGGGSARANSNLQSAVINDLESMIDRNTKTYDVLQKYPCLILNSDYRPLSHLPLSLWNWQDSLRAIFSGRAIMVAAYDITVRSVNDEYELPSIIALKQYHRTPTNHAPTMSRKGIFLRDDYVCQYCDTRFPTEKLSLDHLVPRSRGGKLTWTNTVTACHQCNFAKGANGPEDLSKLGMKLKSKPRVPSTAELQSKSRKLKKFKVSCEDWHDYI